MVRVKTRRPASRDEFTETVKGILAWRVGGLCSKPDCMAPTKGPHSDEAKVMNLGTASHIHAAAKNGPRYDESQSHEERSGAANGIWLCAKHAKEVDADSERFPPELLIQWKAFAENAAALRLDSPTLASAVQSLLMAADELLGGRQSLPDGTWLERPELDELRDLAAANEPGAIALLGVPGSGKSAFLARLGCLLRAEGWNVVAIEGDRRPSTVHNLSDWLPISNSMFRWDKRSPPYRARLGQF
jgi:hypothetical protein